MGATWNKRGAKLSRHELRNSQRDPFLRNDLKVNEEDLGAINTKRSKATRKDNTNFSHNQRNKSKSNAKTKTAPTCSATNLISPPCSAPSVHSSSSSSTTAAPTATSSASAGISGQWMPLEKERVPRQRAKSMKVGKPRAHEIPFKDRGAPYVMRNALSLSSCRPDVRACCPVGDAIIGFGTNTDENGLLYIAVVDEIIVNIVLMKKIKLNTLNTATEGIVNTLCLMMIKMFDYSLKNQ